MILGRKGGHILLPLALTVVQWRRFVLIHILGLLLLDFRAGGVGHKMQATSYEYDNRTKLHHIGMILFPPLALTSFGLLGSMGEQARPEVAGAKNYVGGFDIVV